MTYRRGFQRIYALAAFTWVAVASAVYPWSSVPSEWSYGGPAPETATPAGKQVDWAAEAKKFGGTVEPPIPPPPPGFTLIAPEEQSKERGPWNDYASSATNKPFDLQQTLQQTLQDQDFLGLPQAEQIKVLNTFIRLAKAQAPTAKTESAINWPKLLHWIWGMGIAAIPPILGYLLIFEVLRWIYRGFRPDNPSASSSVP